MFQIETGGHLLRVGGAETLKGPRWLATDAIPRLRVPRRPPEVSQGEVSCSSFTPSPPPPQHPPPLGELSLSSPAAAICRLIG